MKAKRKKYARGQKEYLSSFDIMETREADPGYPWRYMQAIASRMKSDYGCWFTFYQKNGKKYITRLK